MTASPQWANWNYPTPIRFGWGRLAELPEGCMELALKRPLLVTDRGLSQLPVFEETRQLLKAVYPDLRIAQDVSGNPDQTDVQKALLTFRDGDCDGVIVLGGGSPMDAGKAVALLAGHDRNLFDFVDEGENWKRADPKRIPPIVAVPTTAGTGSEVGRVAVITETASKEKRLIFHPKLLPSLVIADPALTAALPPKLTVATGMDALAHNLEAYCSLGYHPMADGIALEGLRLISEFLPKAFQDGSDRIARSSMLAASIMGATAFQKGLGAVHSLAHPLGGRYGFHHGLLNGVLIPYVLKFNREALGQRWSNLERVLGKDPMAWLLDLRQELGVPHTLSELPGGEVLVSAPEDTLRQIATAATQDPSSATNPRKLDDQSHLDLIKAALSGTL